jgi:hypothetical protein
MAKVFDGLRATLRLPEKPAAASFSLVSSDGMVLMEVTAIEFRGENLAMKGKMMGAMPTVAYVHPKEFKKMLSLIPFGVVKGLPAFLWRALRSNPGSTPEKSQLAR